MSPSKKSPFTILFIIFVIVACIVCCLFISPSDDVGEKTPAPGTPSYEMIDEQKGDETSIKKTYHFAYDGKSWEIVASVPKYRYENYQNGKYIVNQIEWYDYEPEPQRAFMNDEYFINVVEQIKTQNGKLTDDELIHVISYFVQSHVDYMLDDVQYGKEYCAYPLEALINDAGDCDCKAALLCGMLYHAGFDSIYIEILPKGSSRGHVVVGVHCETLKTHSDDSHIMHNGKKYTIIESTNFFPIGMNLYDEDLKNWRLIHEPGKSQLIEHGEVTSASKYNGWNKL